jgi:hypothetical protein
MLLQSLPTLDQFVAPMDIGEPFAKNSPRYRFRSLPTLTRDYTKIDIWRHKEAIYFWLSAESSHILSRHQISEVIYMIIKPRKTLPAHGVARRRQAKMRMAKQKIDLCPVNCFC